MAISEGAQKLGRFVASTASMVGERATGAAGAAASGELTAADAGEAAAAAAQAAAGAAGEAAAAVSEKAKALGKLASDDSLVIVPPHSTNEFIWDCCSSFRLLRSRPDTRHGLRTVLPLTAEAGGRFARGFKGNSKSTKDFKAGGFFDD